jgi:DNA-binding LacI/PurR family transcriptional regulator
MAQFLALPPKQRPTALICRNDTAAMVAMSEAGRHSMTVPGDLSVIGFDAVDMGAITNPPLTSVGVAPAELARRAVALLIHRLADPDAPCENILLQPELVARASCAPCKSSTHSS